LSLVSPAYNAGMNIQLAHSPDADDAFMFYGLAAGKTDAGPYRFVGMYVNDATLDMGPRGRRAIEEFLRQGHQAGAIPDTLPVVWQ